MEQVEIKQLNKEEYKDKKFLFTYKSNQYYDVIVENDSIKLELKNFNECITKSSEEKLFADYLYNPLVFGVFKEDKLLGFIEGGEEPWHNIFRISNLLIFEGNRGKGLGTLLMNKMIEYAKINRYRAVVLETQSCNVSAISFYKKCGFKLGKIDLFEYSNNDIENKEVRLDFILKI